MKFHNSIKYKAAEFCNKHS